MAESSTYKTAELAAGSKETLGRKETNGNGLCI